SRRNYTLWVKDLNTEEIGPDTIENTTGRVAWANDSQTFFYVKRDAQTLRPFRVYKHILGQDPTRDDLVFEEKDERFSVGVYRSKSKQYIVLSTGSTNSDEYWLMHADDPDSDFKCFQKRESRLEYDILHFEDHFYILTNKDKATNFKLMKTSVEKTEKENWEAVIPHRKNVLLEDADIFEAYLVLSERVTGLNKIRILRWDGAEDYYLPFESQTYTAGIGHN